MWVGQIPALKYGCTAIMEQCQPLWNLGYVVMSLKRFFKEKLVRNIQNQMQDCMKRFSGLEMKKRLYE